MKIEIKKNKYGLPDAYTSVADVIRQWCEKNSRYDDFIVRIKTTVLGEETTLLLFNSFEEGEDLFEWEDDWYEGGEVELLGFMPLEEVEIPEKYRCDYDHVEEIDEEDEERPTVDVTSDADTEEVFTEVPKTELEKLVNLIKERHPDWDIEEAWDGVFLMGKDGKIVCQATKHWKGDMLEGFDYTRMRDVTGTMTAEEALRWMEETILKGPANILEERDGLTD